jgi:riboflavin kinase / FMN adenylyltransferase
MAQPPRGVYAGRVRADGRWYQAAINVGVNPTFGGDPRSDTPRIEAYLLDFNGDLYGRTVRVEFWRRLRDEERFSSAAELTDQIERDVAATRRLVPAPTAAVNK